MEGLGELIMPRSPSCLAHSALSRAMHGRARMIAKWISSVIPEKLVPAKAGIGNPAIRLNPLDARVRGNDWGE